MSITSRLYVIEQTFSREIDPLPESISDFPEPKDWLNITPEEKKAMLACVERTNDWVNGVMAPKLEEIQVSLDDLDNISAELKERHERFKREHKIVYALGGGMKLAINSACAVIYKANEVMCTILFTERSWSEIAHRLVTPVSACVCFFSGMAVGIIAPTLIARAGDRFR
jgi:hypothetical protein